MSSEIRKLISQYNLPCVENTEQVLQLLNQVQQKVKKTLNQKQQQTNVNLQLLKKIINILQNGYIDNLKKAVGQIKSKLQAEFVCRVIDLMKKYYKCIQGCYKIVNYAEKSQNKCNDKQQQKQKETQTYNYSSPQKINQSLKEINNFKAQNEKLNQQIVELRKKTTMLLNSQNVKVIKLKDQNEKLENQIVPLRKQTTMVITLNAQLGELKNLNKRLNTQIAELRDQMMNENNQMKKIRKQSEREQSKKDKFQYIIPFTQKQQPKQTNITAYNSSIFFLFHIFLGYDIGSFDKPTMNFSIQRIFLISSIQQYCKKKIKRTKLVFAYDDKVPLNPHVHVDGVKNYIFIFRLTNNNIIAAYSQQLLSQSVHNSGPGILINLTKKIKLIVDNKKNTVRTTEYNKYNITFGNDELAFQINKKQISSLIGNRFSYYLPKITPQQFFDQNQDNIYFSCYEVFKIIFSNQQ